MNNQIDSAKVLLNILAQTTDTEKHRGYHVIPDCIRRRLGLAHSCGNEYVFHERERLEFILKNIDVRDKSILDIGCNVGYFLFEMLDRGAKTALGIEGKPLCVAFVKEAITALNLEERFEVVNDYFEFSSLTKSYDLIILMNVLHHIGDDYGRRDISVQHAREKMMEDLNALSIHTEWLVLQMGFNWKGNVDKCLFENGLKSEMIEFVIEGTREFWGVESIGVAEATDGGVTYRELNSKNIERVDELGEFLNRPLFILRSKCERKVSV